MPHSSRIKVEMKVSGWTGHIRQFYMTYPMRPDISGPRLDMSAGHFQQKCLMTILPIFCYLGVQMIPFFFRCIHNFEGIISKLLVSVFVSFLQGFGFGV
jgi:hypothetical protein